MISPHDVLPPWAAALQICLWLIFDVWCVFTMIINVRTILRCRRDRREIQEAIEQANKQFREWNERNSQ